MTDTIQKTPVWFWVVSSLLLLWNIMGVMNFIGQVTMTQEAIDALDASQRALQENRPTWATMAFGFAVFGGLFGCVALLLKKKIATNLFLVSILGVALQFGQGIAANSMDVFTTGIVVITTLIIVLAVFAIWFARYSVNKSWLG
jgi:hypothetical protein